MKNKERSYYGPFFWLAIASFAVPLFVANAAFWNLNPPRPPAPNPDASGVDHDLWDYLLKTHVENGLVDYVNLSRNHLFHTYIRQLGSADPEQLTSDEERLALLCNAYNAFVINGVISHKIRSSVIDYEFDGVGFFDLDEHIFAGKTASLNTIEHRWIRPQFHEPRVHVALVCAAKSCPAIRPEAYRAGNLNVQLDDQADLFANDTRYVDYVASDKRIMLSPILKWYGEDWDDVGGVFDWLANRVADAELKAALLKASNSKIDVVYADYDWTLNAQTSSLGHSPAAKSAEFGSGSIPNE